MSRPVKRKRTRRPTPHSPPTSTADVNSRHFGVCLTCGCTDRDGCQEGCAWVDEQHTLCTVCEGLTSEEADEKRRAAVANLEAQRDGWAEDIRRATEATTRLTLRVAAVQAARKLAQEGLLT